MGAFVDVRLQAPARSLGDLAEFYAGRLGVEERAESEREVVFELGETRLRFDAAVADAFYHFALLVPGGRFAPALAWAEERVELLPDPETGEPVFEFSSWNAEACYFHDPAGNIVELIAHRDVDPSRRTGPFEAGELLGLSELGLVGDTGVMRDALARDLRLELWDGTVEEQGRLAFVGEKARTLILCPTGRPWLPTGRPAEPHPAAVVLAGPPVGEALLERSCYRVRRG